MEVGFIRLGQVGTPTALNLLKAGQRVTVYNRTTRANGRYRPGWLSQHSDRMDISPRGPRLAARESKKASPG
jgi:6-phosphogluconate dehydrogenase